MKITIDRWSALALTRFVLAFIVAVHHLAKVMPVGWLSWVPMLGPFEAMLGFLLISGYSIGSSYAVAPAGFLKRRAWRVYPVYLAAIVLTCFAIPQPRDAAFMSTLLQNVFFTNQITTDTSLIVPAWSLALEVWLYCLTPLLWKVRTEHLRLAMFASFGAYCCYEVCRTALHLPYYAGTSYGANLPLLSFTWLAGFLLAREPVHALRTIRDCTLMFLGHILLTAAVHTLYLWKHAQLPEIWSFLSDLSWKACTLWAVLEIFKWIARGQSGTMKSDTMRLLGDISYPLYVVHIAVFAIAVGIGLRSSTLILGIALLTAFLFYYCVDFYGRGREHASRAPQIAVVAENRL